MKKNLGFSTIELLVTLFVAAAFLLSGYQLYSMIIKDGGETRMQARASNAAYDYLQQYKTDDTYIQSPCKGTTTPLIITPSPAIDGLSNASVEISVSCPYAKTTSISKLSVTLSYGNSKSVTQATYVKK